MAKYKIVDDMIPSNRYYKKSTSAITPRYVIVHNTYNDASAKNEITYMKNNGTMTSFHMAIDDVEVRRALPDHRRSGSTKSSDANGKGISIEICYSKSGGARFDKAEDNAAYYIANHILKKYGWGIDRVKRHQDFQNKYCPHRTLDRGWNRFLKMVKAYMAPTPAVTQNIKKTYKLGDREIWWNANKPIDRGEDVRELQRLLVCAGYDITVDGSFGPAAENAVIAFQKNVNIKDNGVVGKQTIAALSAYIKEGIEDVTRDEIQKMIDDAMKSVEGIAVEAIKKVEAERQGLPASEWSENAIVYAQENGIMIGDGQGNFKPKSYPTREELAQVIYNYDHKKESDKPPESPLSKVF